MSFQPYLSTPTPCWWCIHFDGMTAQGTCALCSNLVCTKVRSSPGTGCSQFQREVGVDDEPWRPPAADVGAVHELDRPAVEWAP